MSTGAHCRIFRQGRRGCRHVEVLVFRVTRTDEPEQLRFVIGGAA